jgi:hypothetical protein
MQRAEATDALVQAIVGKAEGNPFFLEELTRVLLEQHSGTVTAVPETIQGVLLARIDRLPEGQKRVLQTAAVLGREFSGRLLRAVWDGRRTSSGAGALTRRVAVHGAGRGHELRFQTCSDARRGVRESPQDAARSTRRRRALEAIPEGLGSTASCSHITTPQREC